MTNDIIRGLKAKNGTKVLKKCWMSRKEGELRSPAGVMITQYSEELTTTANRSSVRVESTGALYLIIQPSQSPRVSTRTHTPRLPSVSSVRLCLPWACLCTSMEEWRHTAEQDKVLHSERATENLTCSTLSVPDVYLIHGATFGIADLPHPVPEELRLTLTLRNIKRSVPLKWILGSKINACQKKLLALHLSANHVPEECADISCWSFSLGSSD